MGGARVSAAVYDSIGAGYALRRRADPRIAAAIGQEIGDAESVLNVGAGAGSYEPQQRRVIAVEPSAAMIGQRSPNSAPCACARAEALPFADGAFDAAMAILTIHHWTDWRAGLAEMRRTAKRIVLLTFDIEASDFWLMRDYLPALAALDRAIMPSMNELRGELGAFASRALLVPHDCTDGFLGAFWRRPEIYLDEAARRSMSSFVRIDAQEGLARLAHDVESGAWRKTYQHLIERDACDVGYRLIVWD